jgi:hypothetical protein
MKGFNSNSTMPQSSLDSVAVHIRRLVDETNPSGTKLVQRFARETLTRLFGKAFRGSARAVRSVASRFTARFCLISTPTWKK